MMTRDELRNKFRLLRKNIPPSESKIKAIQLLNHLVNQPLFQNAHHIAFYLANDGEMDPSLLLAYAHQQGKICYLPILNPDMSPTLLFAKYQPGDTLYPNRYNIPEPTTDSNNLRAASDLDLVLVPLVSFDLQGNRLGMGKGYYDRSFAFLLENPKPNLPHLVGLAYEIQKAPALPHADWDVPLHAIVTEETVYFAPNVKMR